ncbi:hypothetical protein LCGC14_1283330 [marine sediment metagenome]|uniref:DUF1064 domain-containing protein n=1 Tax=marine sediment metagenome TaxID=412755 RepID=A0A0F9LFL3_9ZZZZ
MANFGHVEKITTSVGNRKYTFRSKLEYRYAVYLQLLEEQGLIEKWVYEPQDMALEFQHGRYGNIRKYLPDFGVCDNEDFWEIHETKGFFKSIDYTKLKKYSELMDYPVTLIFANLANTKSHRAQYNRAKRLEPHIKRVIFDANKTILTPIKHLFEY